MYGDRIPVLVTPIASAPHRPHLSCHPPISMACTPSLASHPSHPHIAHLSAHVAHISAPISHMCYAHITHVSAPILHILHTHYTHRCPNVTHIFHTCYTHINTSYTHVTHVSAPTSTTIALPSTHIHAHPWHAHPASYATPAIHTYTFAQRNRIYLATMSRTLSTQYIYRYIDTHFHTYTL